jgi:glutamate synthase domain-containing protein 2/uncharacterized Fe-S cluster protein YjdI
MKNRKQLIKIEKDGPYLLEDGSALTTSQGASIEIMPRVHLCRCGNSGDKPFCDNTHIETGFTSEKLPGRQPDRCDRYTGKTITIIDNRGVCSHRGYCTDKLPSVFRLGMEPWIDPDGASAEAVKEVISICPSGALAWEENGFSVAGRREEEEICLVKNGPIELKGSVGIEDEEGSVPAAADHSTLCRCGGSKNKPFCDGTHWHNGFKDTKEKRGEPSPAERHMRSIHFMSATEKHLMEPMGTLMPLPSWDDISISGAQLARFPVNEEEPVSLKTIIGPTARVPLVIDMPLFITHMSFGALSKEAKIALARGSAAAKTAMCSGEGGILEESRRSSYRYIYEYVPNEYSLSEENLKLCDAVEIKIGQAVKPGIGGHFPAAKITEEIAEVRNKPRDRDIVTPARYKDIFDRESLKIKVDHLRSLSGGKPVGIKIAAGNIEDDLAEAVSAFPDFITIDGKGGATGSVQKLIKDSASVPTMYALARARGYLEREGITNISLVITGGLRVSSDFAKALSLGADAVAIGTAALMAIGCRQYRMCHTGRCPTGITSQDPLLRARIDIDSAAQRLASFLAVTKRELEIFTRMTGNTSISGLSPEILSTQDQTIARLAGISFGGHTYKEQQR